MFVLIGHAERTLPDGYVGWLTPLRFFRAGELGVHLFFVLSGFIITTILMAEFAQTGKIDFVKFYLRRTRRIFPAFYVYFAVIVLMSVVGLMAVSWKQFVVAGLYLWNYAEALGLDPVNQAFPDGGWYLGQFWTLALEEQFYWFWPLLFLTIARKRKFWILSALILVIPAIRIISYFLFPSVRGSLTAMLHTGIDSILMGCFFAIHRRRIEALLRWVLESRIALSVLTLFIFFGLPICHDLFRGYWTATYARTFEAALIGIFILALAGNRPFFFKPVFDCRPILFLGMISYSLYIWQQLCTGIDARWAFPFPLNIIEALALATASYFYIERPFLRRGLLRPAGPGRPG